MHSKLARQLLTLKEATTIYYINSGLKSMIVNGKHQNDLKFPHHQKVELLFKAALERYQNGQLKAAFLVSQEICKIDFENTKALHLSGVLACELHEYEISLNLFSRAISLKPDSADSFFNRGRVLMELKYYDEALDDYSQAIRLNHRHFEALHNRALVFSLLNRFSEAITDFKVILSINPSTDIVWRDFGNLLKGLQAQSPDSALMGLMVKLLEKRTFVRPSSMLNCGISLLKLDPTFKEILEGEAASKKRVTQSCIAKLSRIPLLMTFMELCPIRDLDIECLLRETRSFIILNIASLEKNPELLRFQNALALHCFTNEYIYDVSEKELRALKKLEKSIANRVISQQEFDPYEVASIATYKSLRDYTWCMKITKSPDLHDIYIRQFLEPLEEDNLKSEMPFISKIENDISVKVREQYEQNPYPRWVNLELFRGSQSISNMVDDLNLKISSETINVTAKPEILVAGCGTGQHSIETASKFKESSVTAIDISVSSLAYAKRKTQELSIKNIRYVQCDILAAHKLEQQYDLIESIGVLHHMDNPEEGWAALAHCLKPTGLMRIALYSKIARKKIQAVRDANRHIKTTLDKGSVESIKAIRSRIVNSGRVANEQITKFHDFYSLSSFRDLVLHVQEHQFTLIMIKNSLNKLGLEFIGFDNENIVNDFKLEYPKSSDLFNLDKWDSYEKSNPNTFSGMYDFWCQKIKV